VFSYYPAALTKRRRKKREEAAGRHTSLKKLNLLCLSVCSTASPTIESNESSCFVALCFQCTDLLLLLLLTLLLLLLLTLETDK